jgi:hypothetical protein
MFSAFHHFRPDAAVAFSNAFDLRRAICIFESGPLPLAVAALLVPARFALMPFVRPFRWAFAVFTYGYR